MSLTLAHFSHISLSPHRPDNYTTRAAELGGIPPPQRRIYAASGSASDMREQHVYLRVCSSVDGNRDSSDVPVSVHRWRPSSRPQATSHAKRTPTHHQLRPAAVEICWVRGGRRSMHTRRPIVCVWHTRELYTLRATQQGHRSTAAAVQPAAPRWTPCRHTWP